VKTVLFVLVLLTAAPAWSQTTNSAVTLATGAVLRGLDTATGEISDIEIAAGETKTFEKLAITLKECRYPSENPAGDAFALLVIRDIRENAPRFDGWMIASTPALSALDHPRYDVWVLHCQYPADAAVKGPVKPDQDPGEPTTTEGEPTND